MKNILRVEDYIKIHDRWEKELTSLRTTVLASQLEETIKWGAPVYTSNGKNIVGLGAFKSYTGLWFFKALY